MTQIATMLGIIPMGLRQKALDVVVDFVSDEAKKYISKELADNIKKLRSDAAFNRAFEEGFQQASKRFLSEYETQDEDLVAAIQSDKNFFEHEQVQAAFLKILKQPGSYLLEEREQVIQSFDNVLPLRKNRQRVDRAVTYFLKCLAEELWHLPEISPIYSLQFQRMTAEAAKQQVELQKTQLQSIVGINVGIREALTQLSDAIVEQKALPEAVPYSLPEKPKMLHNIPQPDYGKFIGRDDELKQIARILRPYPYSQHAIVTIDGIGGVGKTTLALEIANRYLRNYERIEPEKRFEAIIWTSAKQTVLTAEGIRTRRQVLRTLKDIYTAIAITLQREDILHASKDEQDEIVCNALIQQRTLLIVDNLETVDDSSVISFLRELPAPTKAIVTTRHRLDVAYPIRLTGMPWNDADLLIKQECREKMVRLTDKEALHLYNRTGGVPLAIVWSLAQMGFGYGTQRILERLGNPTGDIARFCFEGAIEQIKDNAAYKLLMVLSLCADSANRDALGYSSGLPELDRDDGLVQLEKLSLVNKSGERFSLLPLTKQFAIAELNSSSEKDGFEERWAGYFGKLSQEYGEQENWQKWNWKNYDWLLVEGENILSIVDKAINTGDGKITTLLAHAVVHYLEMKGRWTELISYGEQLETFAQTLNDQKTWAWLCVHCLGWIHATQGNYTEAENFTRRGVSLYQDLGDTKGECIALYYWGRVIRKSGNADRAEKIYKQAMELAQTHSYGNEIAGIHHELGKLALNREQWDKARVHFQASIEWWDEHAEGRDIDQASLMWIKGNLGWVEYFAGNYHDSKKLIERTLSFFERMGSKAHTTTLYARLGTVEKTLGDSEEAIKHLKKSVFWAKRLGLTTVLQNAQELLDDLSVDEFYEELSQ